LELLWQHVYLTGISVLLLTVVGVGLGTAMTYSRRLASVGLAVTNVIYTIPSIALFGSLIFVTGIGNTSAIIAISAYGMLPLIRNTYVGLREVNAGVIEAAVGMGSTPLQLLLRIRLPLALPVMIAGFRTAVVMTIALGGIASFIGAGGLGVVIWRGISTYNWELTIAGSILVALFAITADGILNLIEKTIRQRMYGLAERKVSAWNSMRKLRRLGL
ncbi:MAG: ABC transporter permease, partial [Spirochaetaceae bacterium]